jgi:nucleoid-associated protein YgaU
MSASFSASASIPGAAVAGAAVGAAMGAASALGALVPASITYIGSLSNPLSFVAGLRPVPFDFNPTKISVARSATFKTYPAAGSGTGTPAGSGGAIVWKSDPPDISINEIIFEGGTTKWRCDTLLNWMEPAQGAFGNIMEEAGTPIDSETPTLLFMWGPPLAGFFYFVQLVSTTISYERFHPTGIPIRAKVNLKMKQKVNSLSTLPTNPTSGGLPGRHTHMMRAGESLPSIAMTYYGRPGAWRRIAEINGIDDPSRVRAGTTVYLPSAGELTSGAR